MIPDKSVLRRAILERLAADLALQTTAAETARDEATSEESRAESKYDTRGQEAAYLAEGQARQAAAILEDIRHYETFAPPAFDSSAAIAVGAVVELEERGRRRLYLIGPRAGGLELAVGGRELLIVTPPSPLGRALLGRKTGDTVQVGRTMHRIAAVG